MSAADASMRMQRPQRLVLVAAVLVVLAAAGSIIVPLLHLPVALLAVPALVGLAALLPIALLFSHLRRAATLAAQAQHAGRDAAPGDRAQSAGHHAAAG